MKRQGGILAWLAALLVAVAALTVGAACASPGVRVPAAFGVPGHCYYVDDPAEAQALIASGACPASWAPTPMPVAWRQTYFRYYSSTAYVNRYVPAPERSVYAAQSKTFGKQYRVQITTASRTATWRTGKTSVTPAPAVGTAQFGGGAARAPSYGGGAARGPAPATAPVGTAKYGGGAGRAPAPPPARPAPAAGRSGFGGGARGGR